MEFCGLDVANRKAVSGFLAELEENVSCPQLKWLKERLKFWEREDEA